MLYATGYPDMSDVPRALLTDGERRALRPDSDMEEGTRSSHLSRIRRKIPKMREDARLLREHSPELSDGLERAVCEEHVDDRLDRMEERLSRVESHLGLEEMKNVDPENTDDE